MPPIQAVHATPLLSHMNESSPVLINAHIGTHVTQRHTSMLTYRLGTTFLFEEHLSPDVVAAMCKLGPSYVGSFQAATVQDIVSALGLNEGGVLVQTGNLWRNELCVLTLDLLGGGGGRMKCVPLL